MRPLRFVSWALLLATLSFATAAYDDLPGRIPMHIGFDGSPGNFQPRAVWSWFLVPAIALAVQAVLATVAAMIPRRPQLFNFPAKDRFLRLPKDRQAPVVREMLLMLDASAIGVQGLMLLVVLQLWDAANGVRSAFASLVVPVASLLLAPTILVLTSRVTKAVEREEKRQ